MRRLERLRAIARRRKVPLYLVGGAVRDLLLGLPVRDLDFAVEGDAILLAREIARELQARVRAHGRFQTATVETPTERLDFGATRRESYPRPGALPSTRPAPIEEDLSRRDFTIHAMALPVAPRRDALLDPFRGREDLSRGRIRILHPRSFEDDPTRAYRAARYANRLRFSVEANTRRAARRAAGEGYFDAISGDRRRRELRLILSEPDRAGAVRQIATLGLVPTLHPALPSSSTVLAQLRGAERREPGAGRATSWILYLLVWSSALTAVEIEALADRLALAGEERRIVASWPEVLGRLSLAGHPPRPSEIDALRLSADQIVAAAACLSREDVRSLLRAELARERTRLSIGGRDLVRAGVPPGPSIGLALTRTLAARRDGDIAREEELEYALKAARHGREAP